jgi:gamma-glutamyltranspeptidase/glutathione hydrolase
MPLRPDGLPSADWLHLYTEAARLAFADRALYVADPDFVQPPGGQLDEPAGARLPGQRARLIGAQSDEGGPAGHAPAPSRPAGAHARPARVRHQPHQHRRRQGNALAMTTTIEDAFGARQMVRGFLLNNELTDFSFAPTDAQGKPIANRVQPGKRPRSSMAPTLVFDAASGGC